MHPDLLNNAGVALILAMGIPLAQLIFGAKANLGLILLPIMFYHPFQLFVCGLLAKSFANIKEANLARPVAVCTGYGRS
jgi:solute carrier family 10 (sodium/bile acid cotransporter), member 7